MTLTTTIPPNVLLAALAALAAAMFVAVLVKRLRASITPAPQRGLEEYFTRPDESEEADASLHIDRNAVILASLGLPSDPRYLTAIRALATIVPALIILLMGLPVTLAAGAALLSFMIGGSFLEGRWKQFQIKVEEELPTFVAQLAGTLQVTESPVVALGEVLESLPQKSPLRMWMSRFAAGLRLQGPRYVETVQDSAAEISPSLALTIFLIGRMAETGGGRFADAFTTVAEELSAILEARAVASSKAASARQNVHMLIGILAFIAVMMFRNEQVLRGFQNASVQLVALVSLVVMAMGYMLMNSMINEALEA